MTESAPMGATETGCCPRFEPGPWNEREITFEDRLFLKDRVRSFLHIPLNFGSVMKRNMQRIEAAGACSEEPLLLCDENSLWGADVYLAVSKEIPGAEHHRLSGRFLTRAFEGPYRDVRKWCREMQAYVTSRGMSLKRMLFYYTTCPRCAKVYGKNHVVLLAEVT